MSERVGFRLDDSRESIRIAEKMGTLIGWKVVVQVYNDSSQHFIEVQWHNGVTNQTVGTIAPSQVATFAADIIDSLTLQRAPNNPGVSVTGWYQIVAAVP